MTQVSKRQVGKKLEGEVYDIFWATISKLTNKSEVALFFGEFFTRHEKVNFAKRLSIAILLHKEYDWVSIRDLLKVSPGTIAKMSIKVHTEGFRMFFAKLDKDENWRKFWTDLAKTYLKALHPERIKNMDDEGIEKVILGQEKRTL